MRSLRTLLVVLPLFVACADRRGEGGGTVIVGAAADADALLPGLVRGVQGRVVMEQLFDRLADIGPELNTAGDAGFVPRLATSWSWSADSLAITFRFAPNARWHDGVAVRAHDYAFALRTVREPAVASSSAADVAGIDSIATPDDRTAVVHFARRDAEQFYAATLLVPIPRHLLDTIPPEGLRTHAAARAPVGSGRFRFVSWEPDVRLEIAAVEDHYRGRPSLDRVIFAKSADATSGLARVWAEETDVWEPLTPDMIAEASRYPHVQVKVGPGFDYGFVALNFHEGGSARAHRIFGDRATRRALTMAIDREGLVRTVLDTLAAPALGPFVRAQATADTTVAQIPFDRAAAAATLDSLGWRIGANGIRVRNGVPLRFSLMTPTSSAVRVRAAQLLQQQWGEIGVTVDVERLEFQTMLARLESRDFDATMHGWRTTPSPRGTRATWGSPAIAGAARQNAGRYASAEFDEAVTQGLGALSLVERRRHLRRAYEIINADAAAIWLWETRNAAAVHVRLRTPEWRSDAWWLTLGDWSVDPSRRLARDAAPAAVTP